MGTPYKMKGSPMQRNFGIGSPVKQEKATDKITKTKRSEEIRKGIEGKSKEEKQKILKRNIQTFPYGRLKEGEEYREEMPDFMQDIAIRSDSVRAVVHDAINQKKKKKK